MLRDIRRYNTTYVFSFIKFLYFAYHSLGAKRADALDVH